MGESSIAAMIRLAVSALGSRVFRNNVGQYTDQAGHVIRYGVCNPGGADLIGWVRLVITPDMVGKTVAQFLALEVKTMSGRVKPAQQHFIDVVNAAGGRAAVVRSVEEAESILSTERV